MISRIAKTAILVIIMLNISTVSFAAEGPGCGDFGGKCVDNGGAKYTGYSKAETARLPTKGYQVVETDGKKSVQVVPYEYQSVLACPSNVAPGQESSCARAVTVCVDVPDAVGPLVRFFSRVVFPDGGRGPWRAGGETCWPDLVPGGASRPQLTVAMIKRALRT